MTGPSEPLAAELADAVEHFAHWRRTRSTRSAPTPLALRERAVALLAAHRPSTVARVLGINTVMLERWSAAPESASASPSSSFVALPPLSSEPPTAPIAAAELVLRWPDGGELVARGPIPPRTLVALLEAFAPPAAHSASSGQRR